MIVRVSSAEEILKKVNKRKIRESSCGVADLFMHRTPPIFTRFCNQLYSFSCYLQSFSVSISVSGDTSHTSHRGHFLN